VAGAQLSDVQGGAARPVVLVTGVSRRRGIAAAVARRLASSGWDLALTGWPAYDQALSWGRDTGAAGELLDQAAAAGARAVYVPADLSQAGVIAGVFDQAEQALGPVIALVVVHNYESEPGGGLLEVTAAEFDRSMAVNPRATLFLMAEFARRFSGPHGRGRIVTFTSGLPLKGTIAYAASKGAIEWITISAAADLAGHGITANAVNPGPNDTGWMTDELLAWHASQSPLGRTGRPEDAAELVAFLCSEHSGWVTGQILTSDGGWSALRP
jgi:3-oxoacyl-[acyl-carrier protein] reductase